MIIKYISSLLVIALILSSFVACDTEVELKNFDEEALAMRDMFIKSVDQSYAYDVFSELEENENFSSSSFGTRTRGSDSEHAVADYLFNEMKGMGLSDVEKLGIKVDKWQFNDATLQLVGSDKIIKSHSFATPGTPIEGINSEIIYAGNGSTLAYKDLDVTGKIVLIDIDSSKNLMISYPMLEAQFREASALLISNDGGSGEFSQTNKSFLSNLDISSSIRIPCVNISESESDYIKGELEKGPVTANLTVDSIVEPNGTSYNVMGTIKGNNDTDQIISIGIPYHKNANDFQDKNAIVGIILATAKALIESEYAPDNNLVFIFHGQREIISGPDASINNSLGYINFEQPSNEISIYTSTFPEPQFYNTNFGTFINESDFSPGDESLTVYDERNEEIVESNGFDLYIKLYGSYIIYTDKTPAIALNYNGLIETFKASILEKTLEEAGVDTEAFTSIIDELQIASDTYYTALLDFNKTYITAKNLDADEEDIRDMKEDALVLNKKSKEIYNYVQDTLTVSSPEKNIVPHQVPKENIEILNQVVESLENGDLGSAINEFLWQVNSMQEYYNIYFSTDVIEMQKDNIFLETNKTITPANVGEANKIIMDNYNSDVINVIEAINIYNTAITAQTQVLNDLINQETISIKELINLLKVEI